MQIEITTGIQIQLPVKAFDLKSLFEMSISKVGKA